MADETVIKTTFLLKRGTSADWARVNPVLMRGEPGIETDTMVFRIGDGSSRWLSLPGVTVNAARGLIDASGTIHTFEEISQITGLELVSVQELPSASASTMNKIYLVPSSSSTQTNIKDEYITIRETEAGTGEYTYRWELIGSTAIDLDDYAPLDSPNFTGVPLAPDITGEDGSQIVNQRSLINFALNGPFQLAFPIEEIENLQDPLMSFCTLYSEEGNDFADIPSSILTVIVNDYVVPNGRYFNGSVIGENGLWHIINGNLPVLILESNDLTFHFELEHDQASGDWGFKLDESGNIILAEITSSNMVALDDYSDRIFGRINFSKTKVFFDTNSHKAAKYLYEFVLDDLPFEELPWVIRLSDGPHPELGGQLHDVQLSIGDNNTLNVFASSWKNTISFDVDQATEEVTMVLGTFEYNGLGGGSAGSDFVYISDIEGTWVTDTRFVPGPFDEGKTTIVQSNIAEDVRRAMYWSSEFTPPFAIHFIDMPIWAGEILSPLPFSFITDPQNNKIGVHTNVIDLYFNVHQEEAGEDAAGAWVVEWTDYRKTEVVRNLGTPSTSTVFGENTDIEVDVTPTKQYVKATASGTAVQTNQANFLQSVTGETSNLVTTSITGTNGTVTASRVTSGGTAASWSTVVEDETLRFVWTPNTLPIYNDVTAAVVASAPTTVATGSLDSQGAGSSVMTGVGSGTSGTAITSVAVSAQPTVALSFDANGNDNTMVNVVTGISNVESTWVADPVDAVTGYDYVQYADINTPDFEHHEWE